MSPLAHIFILSILAQRTSWCPGRIPYVLTLHARGDIFVASLPDSLYDTIASVIAAERDHEIEEQRATTLSQEELFTRIRQALCRGQKIMNDYGNVTPGSGNVFADLGLPNPDEHAVKATIALSIAEMIKERGLTKKQAGEILGLPQSLVSNLVRGNLEKFTIDRLMRYMRKLDYDVTISSKPKPQSRNEAILNVKGTPVLAQV